MTEPIDKTLELFNTWKAKPSSATLSPVLTALNPSISKALKTYGYDKDPNMRTSMQLHLASVLSRYDSNKSNIKTFAATELKRVTRIGPRHRFAVPMPEQAAMDLKHIRQNQESLVGTLGRDPTPRELADATGLSSRRIASVQGRYAKPVLMQESLTGGEAGTEPGIEALDFEDLWVEAVYDGLDGTDQKILDWSMERNGEPLLTKTEMARRLGISVSAVTQRSQRLAEKINEGLEYMQ